MSLVSVERHFWLAVSFLLGYILLHLYKKKVKPEFTIFWLNVSENTYFFHGNLEKLLLAIKYFFKVLLDMCNKNFDNNFFVATVSGL